MTSIQLLSRDDLLAEGLSPLQIASAVKAGTLIRIREGAYVPSDAWSTAKPEPRLVARAQALAMTCSTRPVFSHETAAALHRLALYRPSRDRVHTIAPVARPGAAGGVVRHRGELAADDVIEIDGLLCTSLVRTVADVARTAIFEQSVTIADAALRQLCIEGPGHYAIDRAAMFREAVRRMAERSSHGLSRAQRVLEFADGRAQRPGESVSRIRLRTLGFRDIRLQVPVPGPNGRHLYVDFGLEDAAAFGEFDGAIKYLDERIVDGRTAAQILDEEKRREDWIRGTTQRRYARWGWPHVETAAALGARLEAFGIRPRR